MKNPGTALLFALFLCHEACADCFVVDLLEYSAPGEMQGHAYDTFCYRDTLAYYYSTEIAGERYFGKARRKGALLAVWYDSADYEGVIPAPDTSTYVRHNDTLSLGAIHFVRVDVSDESIPFFSGRGDETIGRCETLKKKRRKSSRLKSACDSAKVCCFKSNADDTLCIRDSSAYFYARMSFSVGYGIGSVRYRDDYLMLLQNGSCRSAECKSDTLFFERLGDTLVLDHEVYPSLERSFKSQECRFYLPIDSFPPHWSEIMP